MCGDGWVGGGEGWSGNAGEEMTLEHGTVVSLWKRGGG